MRQQEKKIRAMPTNKQGFALLRLTAIQQEDVIAQLSDKEMLQLFHYLDPDKIADLLQHTEKSRRHRLVQKIKKELREKVQFLLQFDPKSAAGLMSLDYIEVESSATFGRVSTALKKHDKAGGKTPAILVVKEGLLVGELPLHKLALHSKKEKIIRYVHKLPFVHEKDAHEHISHVLRTHPHNKVVVKDEDESILGIVFADEILRLVNKAEHLADYAGVSDEEDVYDSYSRKVGHRSSWLVINLATGFLAASVVSIFSDTISKFVLLAAYMPIVAGMGGNAATQTLAVFVRGIALREIQLDKRALSAIGNEVLAGGINGLLTGLIAAGVAVLFNKSAMLGVVIGLAMIINLMVAGFFGALIPLTMKKLGKDPAASATIFITTATDVLGFIAFLGLAQMLL